MMEFYVRSEEETVELGHKLGKILKKGDNVCLTGELGAGKTAFARGIARALGIGGYITSPTFTIVNEYAGELPLYHFDVYRIGNVEEMLETGFYEYIDGHGVTIIEWADLINEILPENRIEVKIEKNDPTETKSRRITISFHGDKTIGYEGRLRNESAGN